MWDGIEHFEKLEVLPRIVRLAETLPTAPTTLEQLSLIINLIKTDLRNKLNEFSLEGFILIGQEFRSHGPEKIISPKMVKFAPEVIDKFKEKKNCS